MLYGKVGQVMEHLKGGAIRSLAHENFGRLSKPEKNFMNSNNSLRSQEPVSKKEKNAGGRLRSSGKKRGIDGEIGCTGTGEKRGGVQPNFV